MAYYPLPSNNLQAPVPQVGTKEEVLADTIKVVFEANYLSLRKKSTSNREKFTLEYSMITQAEYNVLDAFFFENLGLVFTFVHPISGVNYQVMFSKNELQKEYSSYNLVSCTIELITIT